MREFKDSEGRLWRLALTCASAARIRDNVSIPDGSGGAKPFDLVEAKSLGDSIEAIRTNPILRAEVLYVAMMPDIHSKQIDREGFMGGLWGDELDTARVALEAEVVSFSPGRLRAVVSSMLAKMDELEAAVSARIQEAVTQIRIAEPGMSSGSAPESSASIPANGPSANSQTLPAAA